MTFITLVEDRSKSKRRWIKDSGGDNIWRILIKGRKTEMRKMKEDQKIRYK